MSRVDDILGQFRNEVGAPALHQVRPEQRMALLRRAVGEALLANAAAENLRVVGLAHDDLRFRALLAQYARDAFQRAARAEA